MKNRREGTLQHILQRSTTLKKQRKKPQEKKDSKSLIDRKKKKRKTKNAQKKILVTKSTSILKELYSMSKWDIFRNGSVVKQENQFNTSE